MFNSIPEVVTTKSSVPASASTSTMATVPTTTVTRPLPVPCYDCSGPACGKDGSAVSTQCPSCMMYRNPDDQSTI